METFIVLLILVWALTNIFGFIAVCSYSDTHNNIRLLQAYIRMVKQLFINRNLFGYICSSVVMLYFSPAFVFIVLSEGLIWIGAIMSIIWKLGNRKEN